MSVENEERMLQKIVYLLNLASNAGATPAEAAAAAAKAQEIAFKYNVDLAEATRYQGKPKDLTEGYIRKDLDLGSAHTWKQQLFWAICHVSFCKGIIWTGTRKAFVIGEPHNVAVVEFLYTYLERELRTMANAGWYRSGGSPRRKNFEGEHEGTYKDRFGRGAATAVNARLYAQRQHDEKTTTGGSALIVVKEAELEAAMTKFAPDTRETTSKITRPDSSSWYEGVKAGREVAINPALRG